MLMEQFKKACNKLAELEDKIESGELGDIKELIAENERLRTELQHREEDLIHADERVFYREVAVKFDEDKIKQQAVKEFAEKLKNKITLSTLAKKAFLDLAQVGKVIDKLLKEYEI